MSFPDTPTSYGAGREESPSSPPASAAPATTPAAVRTPRRARTIGAAVAVVLVLMAGTGLSVWFFTRPQSTTPAAATSPSASALEVTGMITLQRGQFVWQSVDDPTCEGLNGFTDIHGGTQVTVTDAAGKTLAVGSLIAGVAIGITTEADGMHRAGSCILAFKVSGVQRGVGPYGVEVAHRGVLHYDEGKLDGMQLGFS